MEGMAESPFEGLFPTVGVTTTTLRKQPEADSLALLDRFFFFSIFGWRKISPPKYRKEKKRSSNARLGSRLGNGKKSRDYLVTMVLHHNFTLRICTAYCIVGHYPPLYIMNSW